MDGSKYGEFLQITAPDKEQLSKMLNYCKGNERTMSQFAEECGVNASTLSRILNGKISKPLSIETLVRIYEHKSGAADFSFEQIALTNGMKEKEKYEQEKRTDLFYNDPLVKFERQGEIQKIVINGLLLRGVMIKMEKIPKRYNSQNPEYKPSIWGLYPMMDFILTIMTPEGLKEWDFYCYAKTSEDDEYKETPLELANGIIHNKSIFFLQDSWEPGILDGIKSSFLFFEEAVFQKFIDQLKKTRINTEVSAILVDYIHGKVLKEVWIREIDRDRHSIFESEIMMEDERTLTGI